MKILLALLSASIATAAYPMLASMSRPAASTPTPSPMSAPAAAERIVRPMVAPASAEPMGMRGAAAPARPLQRSKHPRPLFTSDHLIIVG